MKNIILVVGLVLAVALPSYAVETKKVCHDKLDKAGKVVKGKDGKIVQQCKNIKIHKKLDGAESVPVKK
jgi:hypothetical protein